MNRGRGRGAVWEVVGHPEKDVDCKKTKSMVMVVVVVGGVCLYWGFEYLFVFWLSVCLQQSPRKIERENSLYRERCEGFQGRRHAQLHPNIYIPCFFFFFSHRSSLDLFSFSLLHCSPFFFLHLLSFWDFSFSFFFFLFLFLTSCACLISCWFMSLQSKWVFVFICFVLNAWWV